MAFHTGTAGPPPARAWPVQPLHHLDALWIQVGGTRCNLTCTHCFVSCGPDDDHHPPMSRDAVRASVAEALPLGVKEFYFTGGEPFLHRDLLAILADSLAHGPCTVLTNGTLFTARGLAELARLAGRSRYALELRVSLDGPDAESHDAFRGAGAFARSLDGLAAASAAGLLPIVTATDHGGEDPLALRERYAELLRNAGVERPRIKLIPLFRLGRARGHGALDTLAGLPDDAFDPHRLQCAGCRAVTARGVFVCPLLVDEPGGRMGGRLAETLGPFALRHSACHTCYVTGMTCGNG
jgi:MoaA/NifB/PqqE/SkfB family radical SAM enzyme